MSDDKNDEAQPSDSKQSEQSEPGPTPGSAEGDGGQSERSEPGPTPGSAEGDRETVEEDLREKETSGNG